MIETPPRLDPSKGTVHATMYNAARLFSETILPRLEIIEDTQAEILAQLDLIKHRLADKARH